MEVAQSETAALERAGEHLRRHDMHVHEREGVALVSVEPRSLEDELAVLLKAAQVAA